jgi:hypothetical protein
MIFNMMGLHRFRKEITPITEGVPSGENQCNYRIKNHIS